jgi:hypothetical protein
MPSTDERSPLLGSGADEDFDNCEVRAVYNERQRNSQALILILLISLIILWLY